MPPDAKRRGGKIELIYKNGHTNGSVNQQWDAIISNMQKIRLDVHKKFSILSIIDRCRTPPTIGFADYTA